MGDLFLAANPAVAGVPGWNCQALIESLETVDKLLDALPLSLCYPGHGRYLSADMSRDVISDALVQAETLRDIAMIDPQRVSLLVEYSEELLSEGLALFTIIAGRLCTVSFHLDALEESQAAKDVLQMLDLDDLDAVLDELRSFTEQFRQQHRLEMALPLKGVQTVSRIEKLFDMESLRGLIDPALLRRARHLLDDFMNNVRGIEPASTRQSEALYPIVAAVAEAFTGRVGSSQDLLNATDDSEAFRQALTRRIAAESSAVRLVIDLDIAQGLPHVTVDRERFEDTLHAILSEFAGAGASRVRIEAQATSEGNRLEIRPVPDRLFSCFTPRKVRFLDFGIRFGGGSLVDESSDITTVLSISLTSAASV